MAKKNTKKNTKKTNGKKATPVKEVEAKTSPTVQNPDKGSSVCFPGGW